MRVTAVLLLLALSVGVDGAATVFTPTIDLPKKRSAVVMESEAVKKEYSKFFGFLESFLDVKYHYGKAVTLKQYEEFQFENVIYFGYSKGKIDSEVLDFLDNGNNVMVVAGKELSEELRVVAVECGMEVTQGRVEDNINGKGEEITSDVFVNSKPIMGDAATLKPVTFRGFGMQLENDNPLVTPIISAKGTAFAQLDSTTKIYGKNIALVGGMQTRIGSRATVAGSMDMFRNEHWGTNGEAVKRFTRWAFQQHGILRYRDIDHVKLVDGKEVRDGEMYRIRGFIRYSITIEEFDGEKGEWVPFVPPKDDPVQVEYVMLDPYVRADLVPNGSRFSVDLQAPDHYGIFKFVVDYRRTGYNPLVIHTQAPLRPLKLNEYERFIPAAYPYYTGTFSAMAGFVLIGLTFLYVRS